MKMNPNTGALMPAPGNGNAQPAGHASPGSLLGTPSLLHASAPAAGRSSDAPQTVPPIEDRSPLQPFRPPSPKYDERAGGFFTPAPLGPQPLLRVAATVAAPGAVNPPHADLHTPDDGVAAALHVCVPGPPIQAAAAGAVAAAAARSDEAGSDDDIPSPKYDETTCFFTRPRSTDHRRRPRRPAPAADGPASAAALHPQPAPAPAAATPATPQRPGSHAQPVGSPAVQGLQAPPAASAAPSPALALLTPGNAFTHVRPHGSISQLSVPRPGAAAAAVPLSQAGFRTSVPGQGHQLTILSIEVLAATRGTLTPDPRHDELLAIAFAVWYDHEDVHNHEFDTRVFLNARHVDAAEAATGRLAGGLSGCQMDVCTDEKELLEAVIAAVVALDADVVVGFDVMRWSLGYLDARSRVLDMQPPLIRRIGRCPGFPGAASCPSPMVAAPPLWLHAAAPAVQYHRISPVDRLHPVGLVCAGRWSADGHRVQPWRPWRVPPWMRSRQRGGHACAGVREQYNDEYGEQTAHNLHTSGRVVLNIWRAMQTELKLPIYNFEACCAAILRTRVPDIPHHVLAGTPAPLVSHAVPSPPPRFQSTDDPCNTDVAVVGVEQLLSIPCCKVAVARVTAAGRPCLPGPAQEGSSLECAGLATRQAAARWDPHALAQTRGRAQHACGCEDACEVVQVGSGVSAAGARCGTCAAARGSTPPCSTSSTWSTAPPSSPRRLASTFTASYLAAASTASSRCSPASLTPRTCSW